MVSRNKLNIVFAAAVAGALSLVIANTGLFMPGSTGNLNKSTQRVKPGEEAGFRGAKQYNHWLRANLETGEIDQAAAWEALRSVEAGATAAQRNGNTWLKWRGMGPDNISGRTRALVLDRDNPRVMYAGGVSGGTWKSENGGVTWRRTGGRDVESIIVSSMTQAADGTIYYGTGEEIATSRIQGGELHTVFRGRGVFVSTDRGETFTQLKATEPTNPLNGPSAWNNIGDIKAHPKEAKTVYAGTMDGIQVTKDGGATWTREMPSPVAPYGRSLAFSADGSRLLASCRNSSASLTQFFLKEDGGAWKRVGEGTIPTNLCNAVVAISQRNKDVMYAIGAGTNRRFRGAWRSTDGGATWEEIVTGTAFIDPVSIIGSEVMPQGDYNLTLGIDPANDDRIFIGGTTLWEAKKHGSRFQAKQISNYSPEFFTGGWRNPYYVHPDIHAFAFDTTDLSAGKPYIFYVGQDGGIARSRDIMDAALPTYEKADYGYVTTQFYHIGVDQNRFNDVLGGTQDNGTILAYAQGVTQLNAYEKNGGDGGFCAISSLNSNLWFAQNPYGFIQRSFNRGTQWSSFFNADELADAACIPNPANGVYGFVTPVALYENRNAAWSQDSVWYTADHDYEAGDSVQVVSGAGTTFWHRLTQPIQREESIRVHDVVVSRFCVVARGAAWLSPNATAPNASANFYRIANFGGLDAKMARFTPDGNTLFIGGSQSGSGGVWRITGLNDINFNEIGCGTIPSNLKIDRILNTGSQLVTSIAIDPRDASHVVVTLGTYGSATFVRRSTNALAETPTFTSIHSNLPRIPVYDAAIHATENGVIILGTEMGIYASKNNGATWTEENDGMDRVPVYSVQQVVYNGCPGPHIYIGTHGRGVFRTDTWASAGCATSVPEEKPVVKKPVRLQIFPNPVQDQATVSFSVDKAGQTSIMVMDLQGKVLMTQNLGNKPIGTHLETLSVGNLPKGTYLVRVVSGSQQTTGKLIKAGY